MHAASFSGLFGATALALSLTAAAQHRVSVHPTETDELLTNPGMGWQTFHRFADDDPNLADLPSSSAYFRFYWRQIEPTEGQIDFARFDDLLTHCQRAGQKLAFRIMCTGSGEYMDVPEWLKQKGCKGTEFRFGGRLHWVPDFADPLFQEAHFRLIGELGRRYDGHPEMDLLDIGSIGLWGEWHMSGTEAVETGQPVPLPPVELRHAIIDAWRKAFPKTSQVILIGSAEGMSRTVRDGYGWRADCLGDMGGFSKTWNHMRDFYLQQLEKTGAADAWQQAPVAFESCWDMRKWKEEGWDIPFIFDYALRCHVSYMNNKSAPLPPGTRPEVERFLRKLGYRLVLRSLEHDRAFHPGAQLRLATVWENVGVAPPYRDYRLAVRLRQAREGGPAPWIGVTGTSVRGWLPGRRELEFAESIPTDLAPGQYELALAVVDPVSQTPAVRLAVSGREIDGWYPLSKLEIAR